MEEPNPPNLFYSRQIKSYFRFRKTAWSTSGPKSRSPRLKSPTRRNGKKNNASIKPFQNAVLTVPTEKISAMPALSTDIQSFTATLIHSPEFTSVPTLMDISIITPLRILIMSWSKKKSGTTIQTSLILTLRTLETTQGRPLWLETFPISTPFMIFRMKSIKTFWTVTISFTFLATLRYSFF